MRSGLAALSVSLSLSSSTLYLVLLLLSQCSFSGISAATDSGAGFERGVAGVHNHRHQNHHRHQKNPENWYNANGTKNNTIAQSSEKRSEMLGIGNWNQNQTSGLYHYNRGNVRAGLSGLDKVIDRLDRGQQHRNGLAVDNESSMNTNREHSITGASSDNDSAVSGTKDYSLNNAQFLIVLFGYYDMKFVWIEIETQLMM